MSGAYRSAAVSGGRWISIQNLIVQLLSIVGTAVLTRYLSPADFGIVAAASVALGLFALINQAGWGAALVVRSEVTPESLSTAFWSSVILGAIAFGAFEMVAPLVAVAFNVPEASSYMRVLAVTLLLGQPASIARSLLLRELRFRTLALLQIARQVLYVAVAVGFISATNVGVWAVVIGRVTAASANVLALFLIARPPILLRFDWDEFRRDAGFNGGYLANAGLRYAVGNIDYWLVGRLLGSASLGAYYIAFVLPNIVRQRFSWTLQGTSFPLFARLRGQESRLTVLYGKAIEVVMFAVVPAMVGLAVTAEPATRVLFGAQWGESVAPMRWLAFAGIFEAISGLNGTALTGIGKPHLGAVILVAKLAVLGSVAVTLAGSLGLAGVAVAVVVASVVGAVVGLSFVRRELGVDGRHVLRLALPALISSTITAVPVLLVVRSLRDRPPGLWLAAAVITGIGVYLLVSFLGWRTETRRILGYFASVIGLVRLARRLDKGN